MVGVNRKSMFFTKVQVSKMEYAVCLAQDPGVEEILWWRWWNKFDLVIWVFGTWLS